MKKILLFLVYQYRYIEFVIPMLHRLVLYSCLILTFYGKIGDHGLQHHEDTSRPGLHLLLPPLDSSHHHRRHPLRLPPRHQPAHLAHNQVLESWRQYWSTNGFRRKETNVLTTSEDSLAADYQMKMVKMPDARCQMVKRQPSQYSIRTHRVSPASKSG